jgi:hypothetical protein
MRHTLPLSVVLSTLALAGFFVPGCGGSDADPDGGATTTLPDGAPLPTTDGSTAPTVLEDGAIVPPPPPPPPLPTAGGGHFYYTVNEKTVLRIAAKQGAQPENLTAALNRLGKGGGARDRYPSASIDGAWMVMSADGRFGCQGECLIRVPRDVSGGELVKPGGEEISPEGLSAIVASGDLIVFPTTGGPHRVDLYATRRQGSTWGAKQLLTAASPYEYNNAAALTFDGQRVTFDCGSSPYPEGGNNFACEVSVTGTGFRKIVGPDALPNPRQTYVQNPREGLDGLLFEMAWPVGGTSPEIVWLLPKAGGAPTPIAKNFNNTVAPCPLPDGRFGVLWLDSPSNPSGRHELTVALRDGSSGIVLTPGVDVTDNGVGCSD